MKFIKYWSSISLAILGISFITEASYINIKAKTAQLLIAYSFQTASVGNPRPPWPWADTIAIAKLSIEDNVLYVLSGANMRNLAFGPVKLDHNNVIMGHRDTHFKVLERLSIKDIITLETINGTKQEYRIDGVQVIDKNSIIANNHDTLQLVTCYPFNTISADPNLRYVVSASALVN